jgi:hypothetical protein
MLLLTPNPCVGLRQILVECDTALSLYVAIDNRAYVQHAPTGQ